MKNFTQEDFILPMSGPVAGHPVIGAPGFPVIPVPANSDRRFSDSGPVTESQGQASDLKPSAHRWYMAAGKRVLDVVLVLLSLPIAVPLIFLPALALWIEGGQPFYRQERLGRNGKVFSIWKLRSMVRDAEQQLAEALERDPELKREWDENQKLKNDFRVTRVGALLRGTSIDELPQIWNVLKGEMSLVGPRPMLPEQLPIYGDATSYFALRPGITGIWQVSARNKHAFSYRSKVDAVYYATASLWGDLALMIKTLGVVIRRTGC